MRWKILSLVVLAGLSTLGLTSREPTSRERGDCDNSTLQGRYAFRSEASPVAGGRRLNLALLEFHGDGTYDNLGFTANTDGTIATGTLSANYQINADCRPPYQR
jgi:hypothetical protein